jgi:uncharacterized protein
MDIRELYKKVEDFNLRINPETQALSHCKSGCSRCCYTDISVFDVEAQNIHRWFAGLSLPEKNILKSHWQKTLNVREDFRGESVSSCAFLHEEKCTIYEARPLICRTQGMAFRFREDAQEYVDICSLNEAMLDELSDAEFINLDLLNQILGSMAGAGERCKLSDVKKELLEVHREEN